jgi:hypothetical protein
MVSRPLESPRTLAYKTESPVNLVGLGLLLKEWTRARIDEPEIGDVDEGIIEGGKDSSDAKDIFTCRAVLA